MARRWPAIGVGLAVLWLFVRGVRLLDPANVLGEFLIGLGVGLPLSFGFRRLYADVPTVRTSVRTAVAVVLYMLFFLKELVAANLNVAYRVLAPSMPIEPDVLEVPLRVETDLGITTIANSITLTPGTLTMDYDAKRNTLLVHTIDGTDPEAIVETIRRWEDYALVVFDEGRAPGDPVPTRRQPGDLTGDEDDEAIVPDGEGPPDRDREGNS
ncbi:cation transporter [Halobacteriales archaeon SW_7_68_16]|nr:MAG: cation transporter [Halobacteriales archaeon SW_7_68_16]